jgi:GntR family transcriptional regulator / MocR family aminotransferase
VLVRLAPHGPLAQRVYQSLRQAILSGEAGPGARLPSTRTLARDLGVSRNTVLLAYDQLLAEGYLAGRRGSGSYVAAALPDARLAPGAATRRTSLVQPAHPRLSAYGRRVTSLGDVPPPQASEDLPYDFRYGVPAVADFPHRRWRRLVGRAARDASPASMGYGATMGQASLRAALAAYLRRVRGVVCDPEQVLIVNGSQQALDLAARVLLEPGDRVVIEEPHYQGARRVFLAAGARLVPGPVDAEGLDVARLPGDAAHARVAYVTPSHQFPLGGIMSLARRLALLDWARRARAYVFEDDYDSEYRYEGRPVEAVQALDTGGRVIYLGTLSKVLFPALRVGYLILPPALIATFRAAKWLADRHTPTLEQSVLAEFIRHGDFERHLRRSRTRNAARRMALLEALATSLADRAEVAGANAGVHLVVWITGLSAHAMPRLVARAAADGVGVYPVAPYYLRPPARQGLILGYASLDEEKIRAGIRRLRRALDDVTARRAL